MTPWLAALDTLHAARIDAVLVTVTDAQGSTPRAAGARMVFSTDAQFDTIGGGHLEWRAAQIARAMLDDGDVSSSGNQVSDMQRQQVARIALGPSLGQCCGGTVQLLFERIDERSDDMLAAFRDAERAAYLPQVVLFGAGHVGAAIVRLLATLPCTVLWVDDREDMFPATLPAHVDIEATDTPNAVVDQARPGAYFLLMTHSHALDQQLCERILRRDDIAWFGMIGSRTKRKQFEHRLVARGVPAARLARMTCPIGIAGIAGKEPASIALAVVAQLAQLWELQARERATQPVNAGIAQAVTWTAVT